MFEEGFAEGDSFVHRLDPRVKIVVAVLFAAVVAAADRMPVLLAALGLAALLAAAARLPARALAKRLLLVNGFILFIWLILPFTFPGEALFSVGPFTATAEGVDYSLMVTVKSNAIIIATIALLATSTVFDLVHALSHMRVPPKLIHLFFFTFRYAHVLRLEYERLGNAMRIRCFRPGTDMHTYRSYAYLAGMLLVNSYDRSMRVYDAMKCRGFKGEYYVLDHFEMTARDAAAAAAIAAAVVALAAMEWGGLPW